MLLSLAWLHRHGGIAAQIDTRPEKAARQLPQMPSGFAAELGPDGLAQTALIAAQPKHPVVAAAMRMLLVAVLRREPLPPPLKSGPGLLTRAIAAGGPQAGDVRLLTTREARGFYGRNIQFAHSHAARHWNRDARTFARAILPDLSALSA